MNIMRVTVPSGQTSWIQYIALQDSAGDPVTGLSYLGMTAWYVRDKASPVEISVVTQTVTGVFSSGGLVEVDGSNLPGVYRFDIPNAVFTYGVNNVMLVMQNASMQQFCMYIQLDPPANVTQIVGNTTAGPNLKDFAVTGYDATNHRAYADVTAVSGDAPAADNLEAMLDGTRAILYLSQLNIQASSNNAGVSIAGAGTGAGVSITAGATGNGLSIAGGATSGDGIHVTATSGDGADISGGTNGDGMRLTKAGTGVDLRAGITGTITGNLSGNVTGSVASVTGAVGSVTGSVGSVTGSVGSVVATVSADMVAISGDSVAADNAEKLFDNTGLVMSNSTIGTVTNVTNSVALQAGAVDAIWDEPLTAHTTPNTPGAAMNGVEFGTATATTLSTTQMSTNLTATATDFYKDRVLIWISGTLARQAVSITGYNGTTKTLTFTAATSAPSNGNKFIIV